MSFGHWSPDTHISKDQKKRFVSAKKSATSPRSVDKEGQTALFSGSGSMPYSTTLDSCTCVDFLRRKLPCKHIYRLAMECGLIDGEFESGLNKNDEVTLYEAVEELEKLDKHSQLNIKELLRAAIYDGRDSMVLELFPPYESLLDCNLIHHSWCDPAYILATMRKKDVVAILEKVNLYPEQTVTKIRKDELVQWCIENVPNLQEYLPKMISISLIDSYRAARRKTYSYLLRKYDWEPYLSDDKKMLYYPHGATATSYLEINPEDGSCTREVIFEFPDDDITLLLTKYGHNRCLNGARAVEDISVDPDAER